MVASMVVSDMSAATKIAVSSCANNGYFGTAYAVLFFVLSALLGGFLSFYLLLTGGLLLLTKNLCMVVK